MTHTELKSKPHIAVHRRGLEGESIIIRDRCDRCEVFTRPDLCPQWCKRIKEAAYDWTGPLFLSYVPGDYDEAIEKYRQMYPEECTQLELFS